MTEKITITVTGAIVNGGALDMYNHAYSLTGNRESALDFLYDEAKTENWARQETRKEMILRKLEEKELTEILDCARSYILMVQAQQLTDKDRADLKRILKNIEKIEKRGEFKNEGNRDRMA